MRSPAVVAERRVVAVLLGLVVWLAACSREVATPPPDTALTVTTSVAVSRPVPRLVSASGTIRAWQELPIGAETSGVAVMELYVDEGDPVRRGQPLAQLNDRVLRAQLAQQEAAVAEARATSVEAQANLARAEEMRRRDATSAQNLDARRAAAATSSARLAVAEAARAETATRLSQMRILAPADGYVSSRRIEIGEVVSAGQQLFRIVRDGRLELDAEIPETDLTGLHEGQAAQVITDGGRRIDARVRAVAPAIDPHTRLGIVHLALPQDAGVRPGMFARAEIAIGDVDALVVPQSAIVWRDGRAGCFVVGNDGRAVFRAIQTGARSGGEVEIRSGISAGEHVALSGAGFLEDGDRVHVADDGTAGATASTASGVGG